MVSRFGYAHVLRGIFPKANKHNMLSAKQIQKSFKGHKVLDGVDICVAPGKITVLIGPSGAGKTTLLKALALLDSPDSGEVTLSGQTYSFPLANATIFNPPWPELTVVFQQHFL